MDYVLPNHPAYRSLFVTQDEDGEDINFLLTSPKTPEDLLRRRECYTVGIRSGGGVIVHCMGADALAAFTVAAQVMDRKLGMGYMERGLGSGKSNKVLSWEKEATSMFFDEFS